jgi:hypothetical protein
MIIHSFLLVHRATVLPQSQARPASGRLSVGNGNTRPSSPANANGTLTAQNIAMNRQFQSLAGSSIATSANDPLNGLVRVMEVASKSSAQAQSTSSEVMKERLSFDIAQSKLSRDSADKRQKVDDDRINATNELERSRISNETIRLQGERVRIDAAAAASAAATAAQAAQMTFMNNLMMQLTGANRNNNNNNNGPLPPMP